MQFISNLSLKWGAVNHGGTEYAEVAQRVELCATSVPSVPPWLTAPHFRLKRRSCLRLTHPLPAAVLNGSFSSLLSARSARQPGGSSQIPRGLEAVR
jgi:hypothetical protein